MKTKNLFSILILAALMAALSFAQQNTVLRTTLSAAATSTDRTVTVASATGISVGSALYIVESGQVKGELSRVTSVTGTIIGLSRVQRSPAHASGAQVLVATTASWFQTTDPIGSCTTASSFVTPWVNTVSGRISTCDAVTGTWVAYYDRVFFVPPTQCTTAPTTSTVTNTYPQVGASTVFVLNATTNAAAGTTTLVCNILIPSAVTATRGAILKDITVAVGSQTTAPTSIGTATMGTISFPTPVATTQTASTVTPVTAGTVTQLGPTTTVLTVTTAGAFLTFKYSLATALSLSTDLQILQFTVPYLQSAAAAMTLNWPGLWVHYIAPAEL